MAIKKRGVFFSIDSLIALIIILLVLIISYPVFFKSEPNVEVHYDIINTFSSLKVSEINNSYVQSLVAQGVINNTNNSLLEQIGEIYVTDINLSRSFSDSIFSELDFGNMNVGIWYGDKLISSLNSTPIETAERIDTARQVISGIKEGGSVSGFSARAFLTSNLRSKYFYFGGYAGDGNITAGVDYNGTINSAEIELAINNDFDLYINGNYAGRYKESPSDFTPVRYNLVGGNLSYFNSGANVIDIKGDNLYIAGGFIKVDYDISGAQYEHASKYSFPGVSGLINVYDGFYVPGNLSALEIYLHFNSSYNTFLNIGNKTVFRNSTQGEQSFLIDNAQLSSLLDYNSLSKNTIPVRFGMENVSYAGNLSTNADVISVSDLSGSMVGAELIAVKESNKILIDVVLNVSGNRVGLVGYSSLAYQDYFHSLSNNSASLKSEVDSWSAGGFTCICCGINRAASEFAANSSIYRLKSMIVMSDGGANKKCDEQNTGNPKNDAIQAACEAHNNYNITVHAVGFGNGADEDTLQQIAACGGGDYYFGSVSELVDIYKQIANNILSALYKEQTILAIGNVYTRLYPDSYIEFSYVKEPPPFGLLTSVEKVFNNAASGSFSVSNDSTIVETKVISYSGPQWTNNVLINEIPIYELGDYGSEYVSLGDPYAINIPNSFIQGNNIVNVSIGISPANYSVGTSSNKIIYTIAKDFLAYSSIASITEGCNWNIQFEDDSNLTISIPSAYSGANVCYYQENIQQYDGNDALQGAVYNLLRILDFNLNNKIDTKFSEQDMQIDFSEVTGIPFTWSTEVQVRTWS